MKNVVGIAFLAGCMAMAAWAGETTGSAPPLGKLASLVGTWRGETDMKHDGKMEPFTVSYKLTAGGSALVETLMAGSPHEMVTMYTRDKGDFIATHYCMAQNQPRMRAKDTIEDNRLDFEFVGATGMASPEAAHMHSLSIAFTDDDHITQTWSHFEGGKETSKVVFPLTRQK